MARTPEQPTPAELELLQCLWENGPSTVREAMDKLNKSQRRKRAYTSVMTLLSIMVDKGLLERKSEGRAYVYSPKVARDTTLGRMVGELCKRAFGGSSNSLVAHLLNQEAPSAEELSAIEQAIKQYKQQQGDNA